jgi:hypothetical protein
MACLHEKWRGIKRRIRDLELGGVNSAPLVGHRLLFGCALRTNENAATGKGDKPTQYRKSP